MVVTMAASDTNSASLHVASSHVVATAGHIDHGKSTLVRTLTGVDPDRWQEEKARGLTIDLGFAACQLPSGREISFIDVPGHVRFLKNMLAGVGAVDACVFVVAATEGWKPQSEEHLRILQLLGIRHGVVALTKVGIVDDEWAELAQLDVADHLVGTFLEHAEIVPVDALTGRGVDELRAAIDRSLAETPTAADKQRPRLWVDRSFSVKGAGTIVTGTLTGGVFALDDDVELLGPTIGKSSARIRSLQLHGKQVAAVGPGHRVAVNLSGVAHDAIGRGDAMVKSGQWWHTRRFDARLQTLASIEHEVSRRGAFALYVGAGEHAVKLRILETHSLQPGSFGFVRIHLPVALPLGPGDRFVLRDHGRELTVGGGEVLDVAPVRPASKAHPSSNVQHIVAERGWVALDQLDRLSGGQPWTGTIINGSAVDAKALETTKQSVRDLVTGADALGLDPAQLADRQRAVLTVMTDEGFRIEQGRVVQGEVIDPLADHPFVRALIDGKFSPPDATGVDRAELRELIRRKLVIEQDGVWFAPATIAAAAQIVAHELSTHTDGVTVAEVRDALGATRKHVLPLLAYLDGNGYTRRRGDLRIAGPKLPPADPT